MKSYIGTKVVRARRMTRGEYNEYRGWDLPANENPADDGYLVEYPSSPNQNHPAHSGYISWSPLNVFRKSYREAGASLTFGEAIEALKAGHKIARTGWNGKGMFLYYVGPGRYPPSTPPGTEIAAEHLDFRVPYRSYIAMFTVARDVVPWVASQSDILEEDWVIVL